MVFAAASLKPAFTQISQQFKAQNPGSNVEFEFAGSSELATQLTQGATRRRLRIGGHRTDGHGRQGRLLSGNPTNFATNTLVIVTAPGNPKKVGSFADLAQPGLDVVICQKPVPCGSATQRVEESTGVRPQPGQ